MGKFLMVADDFTGAGDAGVQMTKNGIEAHIIFHKEKLDPDKSYVVDSESRNIPKEEAYKKVKTIYESLSEYEFDHYYKKIDSTIRGNLKDELQAAAEVLQPEIIVFNPANPDSNRTVIDGTLMFNGTRICETEIMRDPLCLVTEDNLKKLVENDFGQTVQYFSLNQVRDEQFELDGSKFITFDVLDNRDLENVVKFVLGTGKKVLWVGSAGMANALFKTLRPKYPVLALVGSISETSRSQVRVAEAQGAQVVKMDVAELLKGGSLEPVAREAIAGLKMGNDVVVVSAKEHDDYLHAVDIGKKQGMKREEVAKYTQEKIGILSTMILKEAKVCGTFLTGGDTAISVTEKNHATGATIRDEVLPIIALVELDGGDFSGLPCIVKGGSIGDQNALADSIKYYKEK